MSLRSVLLKIGRAVNDASFVLLEPCSAAEKLKTLSQLARIAFVPMPSQGKVALGSKNFRARYLNQSSFRQAYHEVFLRQMYFFRSNGDAPLIIDCGANIGLATLYFKTLYPRSAIEAFEPDPLTFSVLKDNVERNRLRQVSLHQCALWDSEGELDFYTDESNPGQLAMSAQKGRLGAHEDKITVPARRLSQFLEGRMVDFLKIDVEGAEERLLSDLIKENSLEKVRRMAIEYHHPLEGQPSRLACVLRMLETKGFDYELYADLRPRVLRDRLHDVLICAYKQS